MADDARRGDPTAPWWQLYRATVGAVSDVLADGDLDALGFHRQWLADRSGSGEGGPHDGQAFLRELAGWTAESARRAVGLAALAARLAPHCGELAAAVPRQMVDGGLPIDPVELSTRLYDATSGPLSTMIQELLSDDAFLQLSRRALESWVTAESVLARLSEDVFRRLQLSTVSDTARVATLVVGLDEKVDRLEDALDDLDPAELARLREQVARVEAKLDRVLAAEAGEHAGNGTGDRTGGRR